MKIAIAGKKTDTINYVKYVQSINATSVVTLNIDEVKECDALILPGGGDITPAFFGEQNHGSRNIDTPLDILQLQVFDLALHRNMPVLGICKGMQIMNVALGGTIIQDLPPADAARHQYDKGDKYHNTVIGKGSWLYKLYGEEAIVNSAHHQAVHKLGKGLHAIQHCPVDGCIEAIAHETLPLLGVQWHPERINTEKSGINGRKVLDCFSSLISASVQSASGSPPA